MKKLTKIRKTKLSELVANELKEYIIKNQLKPGSVLPTEMEMVELFAVSRSSIREGIKYLQNLGIVESLNKKGLIVKEADLKLISKYLQYHIDTNRIEHNTLFEAIMSAHLGIVPLLIKKITDEDISILEKLLDRWKRNYTSISSNNSNDIEFHEMLFKIADNEILLHYKNILKVYLINQYSTSNLSEEYAKKNFEMHQDIMQSLKERNLQKTINAFLIHNEFPNTISK